MSAQFSKFYRINITKYNGKSPFLERYKIDFTDDDGETDENEFEVKVPIPALLLSRQGLTIAGVVLLATGCVIFWPGDRESLIHFFTRLCLGWLFAICIYFLRRMLMGNLFKEPSEVLTLEVKKTVKSAEENVNSDQNMDK